MFDETLTLCTGSSLPAADTVRVTDIFSALAICTCVGGGCRGAMAFIEIATTNPMTRRAKIQRKIVIEDPQPASFADRKSPRRNQPSRAERAQSRRER